MSVYDVVKNIPAWAGTLLLSAATGIVVYWWKEWTDGLKRKQKERLKIVSQLQDLKSLLSTSIRLAVIQREHAEHLVKQLQKKHPQKYANARGLEDIMAHCYPDFDPGEKELHGIIRAYSEYSMRRINEALQKWVENDRDFKTGQVASSRNSELAARLRDMEMHMLLWFAKFESWLPDQPHHALVYMADEKAHGLGFPCDQFEEDGITVKVHSVDTEVDHVLNELRMKWKLHQS